MSANDDRLVLASASPRRRRLLAWLELPYEVTIADVEEDLSQPLASDPPALARLLAEEKALAVANEGVPGTILGFDTIVVLDGDVLGKPIDIEDARRMLKALSGGTHEVVTGVAIVTGSSETRSITRSFSVTSTVKMVELTEEAIESWIAEGELLGCAGAYNIERHLASVDLDQCFQNVAGLPLCHLFCEFEKGSMPLPGTPTSPVASCDSARSVNCKLGPNLCP